jgi:hypothetical protein
MTIQEVKEIAKETNWKFLDYQKNIGMISFIKKDEKIGNARMNIYLTKRTVATVLDHPTKKRQQLFRKKVDMKLMKKLFVNPRLHTGIGYYTKG